MLALVVGVYGLAACSHDDDAPSGGTAERALTAGSKETAGSKQTAKRDPQGARPAGPPVRMELAGSARLDRSAQTGLASSVRRFATTLVAWLYGDRREVDVEPVTARLTRELATAPPYIPPDQIGSVDGRALAVQVYVQTSRSGVLVVTVRDSRASYPIPASFELRASRWQVVHLNTH